MGATSPLTAGGAASYNYEPRGFNSGILPLGVIIRDHPRPPVQGAKKGGPRIAIPFYANDVAFNGLERRSAQLLNLLMGRGQDRGYFLELAKSLLILDTPGQEEAARREFTAEVLALNFSVLVDTLGAIFILRKSWWLR